jgi:hypothetical protein
MSSFDPFIIIKSTAQIAVGCVIREGSPPRQLGRHGPDLGHVHDSRRQEAGKAKTDNRSPAAGAATSAAASAAGASWQLVESGTTTITPSFSPTTPAHCCARQWCQWRFTMADPADSHRDLTCRLLPRPWPAVPQWCEVSPQQLRVW